MSYKRKKNKYEFFYKYFYSWYLLPIIFLHELTHLLISYLLFVKVRKIRIYKDKNEFIFNGIVISEIPNKKWKQYLISYAPYLLLLNLFLIYYSHIFIWISLYLFSTIFKYKNQWIFMVLPSKSDLLLIEQYEYHKCLYFKLGEKYYKYRIKNILNKKILQYCLISYEKFKQNKNKCI